ncbi:MAG: efflux RND transporter periplasmic adaptor subunit [Prevotellaceae bacterium]|jgi:multidrug resistance efflux pump|nr:efflux RND transporter periplasmic adaptor subunit [Prevotellaceae bacterium]
MKRKKLLIIIGVAAAGVIAGVIYFSSKSKKDVEQRVEVQKGVFEIIVSTTGDLQALNMERIDAPEEIRGRNVRISEIKILDLVPEGTVVDSGAYVGSLDRSSLDNTLKTTETELEQMEAQYQSALVDTSINLQNIRDNILNILFSLEESKITMEQSVYEPPATQRKAKNDYDKVLRSYEQEQKKYLLRKEQELSKVRDIQIKLSRKQSEYDDMQEVLKKFTIYAPKPGMVIYYKMWDGTKRKIGSSVSPWDRTIATLPDLSVMMSKTYVNEVDISKIRKGQKVRIGVDAFPDKQYTGEVTEVANVGEQLRNADAKVFEVIVRVNESDTILRPSMTTSNKIVIATHDDVMFLPLEALHADSITYVYRTNGTKQVVITGEMNDNYRIIEEGLKPGDEVFLSTPENADNFKLSGEDLISKLKEREAKKLEEAKQKEEEQKKQQEMRRNRRYGGQSFGTPSGPPSGAPGGRSGGGGGGNRRRS